MPPDSEGAKTNAKRTIGNVFFAVWATIDDFLTWTAKHWWFEVVVFILAFSVVVLKTDDIQRTFSKLIPPSLSVSLFWFCVAAWVLSFGARKRAESKVSASNRGEATKLAAAVGDVQGSADDLKRRVSGLDTATTALDSKLADAGKTINKVLDAVETLPHAAFRKAWMEQAFNISLMNSQTRRSDLDSGELAILIRLNLAAVASLAKAYDIGSKATYAANIMFFIPNLGSDPFFEHEIWRIVRFKSGWWDTHQEQVDGVLLLKKELSVEPSKPMVNSIQHDIGFIAATRRVSNKWRDILPGGPRAFANGVEKKTYAAHGYDDISRIDRLNQEDFDIPADVLSEIKDYYSPSGEGRDVKSFFAVTLPRAQNFADLPLGVLNIHSSAPGMLGGRPEKYDVFAQLLTPFVCEIAWAAELWASKASIRLK